MQEQGKGKVEEEKEKRGETLLEGTKKRFIISYVKSKG